MTAQTILPANSVTGGFEVANSCRFNDGDSAYMHKTPGGAGTSADLFTFSMWIKRGIISSSDRIVLFDAREDAENFDRISFTSDDTLEWKGIRSDSQTHNLTTTQLFRDSSAWMHLHFIWDSADGTADNRMRIYVNGTQVTAFGTRANPTSGLDAIIGAAQKHSVGSTASSGTYYDGYMAEVVYLDGQELTPDGNTGEFDEDSGIWKPKKVSGLTFGTNGFYLDFQASGNLGNDANGGTDLTEVNLAAADQTTDTCTNNFATLNPLRTQAGYTKVMSEGNCVWEHGQAGQNASITSTIAASSGKWYAEFLCSTNANNWGFGIAQVNVTNNGSMAGYPDSQGGVTYVKNGNLSWYAGGDESSDTGTTFATDDIIAILMDLDNTRVYWYKNDTLVNSGGFDYSVVNSGSTLENNYYFMVGATDNGTNPIIKANFGGSPGFAISSGNTDGNGYGNFEYATKGGYALNTKNLAEFG